MEKKNKCFNCGKLRKTELKEIYMEDEAVGKHQVCKRCMKEELEKLS